MPTRNELLGDELTRTIDKINAVVRRRVPPEWADDVDLLFTLFGDFWAETLGRATVLASGAVVAVVKPLDARVTELERAIGERGD
jgi:hypothetical protein